MASGKTARKNIPFPKSGDNDTLCADQESAAKHIDEINEGHQDFLQAGVVASTDWNFTANINSGTGTLGSTGNTGGTAWLPDPVVSGALMRSVTAPATLSGIAPSLLPASGKYVSCAFELTPSTWGAAATVTAHSGTEKNTEAEAQEHPPATIAGKMQVLEAIIKNTSGNYSIVAQRDRRPWAMGAKALLIQDYGLYQTASRTLRAIDASKLALRIECTGHPLRLRFSALLALSKIEDNPKVGFLQDGNLLLRNFYGVASGKATEPMGVFEAVYDGIVPSAGSHLFQPAFAVTYGQQGSELTIAGTESSPIKFAIEELMVPNAIFGNNGTS